MSNFPRSVSTHRDSRKCGNRGNLPRASQQRYAGWHALLQFTGRGAPECSLHENGPKQMGPIWRQNWPQRSFKPLTLKFKLLTCLFVRPYWMVVPRLGCGSHPIRATGRSAPPGLRKRPFKLLVRLFASHSEL